MGSAYESAMAPEPKGEMTRIVPLDLLIEMSDVVGLGDDWISESVEDVGFTQDESGEWVYGCKIYESCWQELGEALRQGRDELQNQEGF